MIVFLLILLVTTDIICVIDNNSKTQGHGKTVRIREDDFKTETKYGIPLNRAGQRVEYHMNKEGTQTDTALLFDYGLAKLNNPWTYGTYNLQTRVKIRDTSPMTFDAELLKTNRPTETNRNLKLGLCAVTCLSKNDGFDTSPAPIYHLFFDIETGKECAPRLTRNFLANNMAIATNPYLIPIGTDRYYAYQEMFSDANGNNYQTAPVWKYDSDTKKWISYAQTDPQAHAMMQHPTKEEIVVLYDGGTGKYNVDPGYGYKLYDIKTARMVGKGDVPDGYTPVINFTSDGTKLVAVDNRRNADGYGETSYVNVFDIETNKQIELYSSTNSVNIAVGISDTFVATVSFDGHLYVFDKKTRQLMQKTKIPDIAFENNSLNNRGQGYYVKAQLEIINEASVAILFNTGYFYTIPIISNSLNN